MDIFSPIHIILLLIVALLVFGPKRLPEIGSGLGKSIREFRQSMNNMTAPKDSESPTEYSVTPVTKDDNSPQ